MKILSDKFFDYAVLFVFVAICLLIYLTAYPSIRTFLLTGTVHAFIIIILPLLVIRKLIGKEAFHFDLLCLFLCYLFFSFISNPLYKDSQISFLVYFLKPLAYLFMYFILINTYKKDSYLICIKAVVFIGVVEALIGASQVMFEFPAYKHLITESENGLMSDDRNYLSMFGAPKKTIQASGTFGHFNQMGGFMDVCAPLAYGVWRYYRTTFWFVVFAIIFYGGIVTFSRGCLISMTVGVFLVYVCMAKNSMTIFTRTLAIATVAYLLAKPLISAYAEDTNNADVRSDTWDYAFAFAEKTPINMIFGRGYDYFRTYVLDTDAAPELALWSKPMMKDMHSAHVQLILEQGIIGATLFYVGMIFVCIYFVKSKNHWGYAGFGMIIAFLIGNLFEHMLFSLHIGFLYFSVIGLIISVIRDDKKKQEQAAYLNK